MKNRNKFAQVRLIIGFFLIVASPSIAILAPHWLTPLICVPPPSRPTGASFGWSFFPCFWEVTILMIIGLATPVIIGLVLVLWRERSRPRTKK